MPPPPRVSRDDSSSQLDRERDTSSPQPASGSGSQISNILVHSREAMFTIFDRVDENGQRAHVMPELNKLQFCFKITLLASNLIFMIFGIILILVGAYALTNQAGALAGVSLPKGIIALGVFVFAMSLLGAVSAWKESRIFLGIYFVILLLLAIILLSVGVAVYNKRDDGEKYLREGWTAANTTSPELIESIQLNVHCCGLDVANDTKSAPCLVQPTEPPCFPKLMDLWGKAITNAGACGIAFSIIMASGMTFVCCLMNGIKTKSVAMQKQRRLQQQALEFDQSELDQDDIGDIPQYRVATAAGGGGGRGGVR